MSKAGPFRPFRVVFFVKAPVLGQVKTRLAATLGEQAALEVHRAMLLDRADMLAASGLSVAAHFFPPQRQADMRDLLGPGFDCLPQQGADLGERMARALEATFAQGFQAALLLGGDAPGIDRGIVEFARKALDQEGPRAVVGPAEDGGYYMIGFTREAFTRRVFEDIPWSGPRVLALTLDRLRREGLEAVLAPRLRDLDDAEDFCALAQTRHLPPLAGSRLSKLLAEAFPC